jgi:ATP-dependent Clp protease ATP-binding subunit ClpC
MSPSSSRIRWQDQTPENPSDTPSDEGERIASTPPRRTTRPPTPILDGIGRDLTRLAQEGRLKPLFGREKELLQLQRILIRKEKNTPLLVGAPGVGKTSLVEGFASRAIQNSVAEDLQDIRIVEISASSLTAGTAMRGSFESRLQSILQEVRLDPDLLLFIDEIHTLIRAGAVEGGSMDAANILKPALSRGEFKLIGATTIDEYEKFLRADLAFERRFEPLILQEPTESEAFEILNSAKSQYERHHRVHILPEAIREAVHLSSQHILDRRLPDKAFDLLDYTCTIVRLPEPDETYLSNGQQVVDADAIARGLASKLGIPVQKLTQDFRDHLGGLESYLNERIIGQPLAISRISSAVGAAFAGLVEGTQPKGVFAFFGSTGIGKTATAKALAEYLFDSPDAMIRLDMSEFKEAHTISRLFGSPPGYVGYGEEGSFASRLRRQPFTIVLLDEIEKAHPEIHDAFLQIFDEGRSFVIFSPATSPRPSKRSSKSTSATSRLSTTKSANTSSPSASKSSTAMCCRPSQMALAIQPRRLVCGYPASLARVNHPLPRTWGMSWPTRLCWARRPGSCSLNRCGRRIHRIPAAW